MPQRARQILLMEEVHVARVAEIAAECFSEPWSERAYRSELQNPQAITMVALEDGAVVGFVNAAFAADQVDLNTVAVTAAARKRGIGRALLQALEAWVADFAAAIFLEVRESNAPAQALYAAMGYTQVGRRPRYYHEPDEDGLLLRKPLRQEDAT